jgi:hypothetical protein
MRGDAPVSRGGATGSTDESAEMSEFVELRNSKPGLLESFIGGWSRRV